MRKSRFTDEQITSILAEQRAGTPTVEICRKYTLSSKTLYAWKAKFGQLQGTEVRRMKDMETQINRLERIVAKQAVELQAAQEIIRGKW
jgi:putative transposase